MRRRAAIQFASGLYANRGWRQAWSALVPGAARTLALLGNCGSVASGSERQETLEFLRRCSATWEQVLWVPGPEEVRSAAGEKVIYPYQIDALEDLVQEAAQEEGNVLVMNQREEWDSKGQILYLGATGWGPGLGLKGVPSGGPEEEIYVAAGGIIVPARLQDIAEWHDQDLVWLEDRAQWWRRREPAVRIVILTHALCQGHLLSQSLPKVQYERFPLDCIPKQSTESLLRTPGLYAWLCGATGGVVSGFFGGAAGRPHRIFSAVNARQGAGAWINPQYDPARRLELR